METILEADQSMHIWTKFVFIPFSIVLIKVPMAQTHKAGQHDRDEPYGLWFYRKPDYGQ
jgi:hypothetical protein